MSIYTLTGNQGQFEPYHQLRRAVRPRGRTIYGEGTGKEKGF